MQKIVLLDLDGTLGDTKYGIIESVKYALKKINYRDLSDAELNEFIGSPIFEAMIDAGVDSKNALTAVDEYRYAYAQPVIVVTDENMEFISPKVKKNGVKIGDKIPGMYFAVPFQGIVDMMRQLFDVANKPENNWKIITGTSKPELWAREIINNFGISDCFSNVKHNNMLQSGKEEDLASNNAHIYLEYEGANELKEIIQVESDGVFGASMDKCRTSKQAVLEYALDAAGYNASTDKAILIGDRKHDIIGAHNIGLPVIGCEWGYALENELEPAEYTVSAPNDIIALLEKIFK